MNNPRRSFSTEQKATVLKVYLVDNDPPSRFMRVSPRRLCALRPRQF